MMILCVFFEQALEARGSYPLKAVTGTTTALFAHLAEALWLVKVSIQTLITSFFLNFLGAFRTNDVVSVCNKAFVNQRASSR